MTKWARIEDEIVVEVIDIDPSGRYHESIKWFAVSDEVEQGWVVDDGSFATPDPALPPELPHEPVPEDEVDLDAPIGGLQPDQV